MTTSSRRDRLRPVELLGISAIVAVFIGLVVLMSTRQIDLAVIFLCIAFIVVVVILAMLQLASTSDQDDNDMLGGHKDPKGGDGNGFH
jgi:type IV secretory pathway VirB3-like protein